MGGKDKEREDENRDGRYLNETLYSFECRVPSLPRLPSFEFRVPSAEFGAPSDEFRVSRLW